MYPPRDVMLCLEEGKHADQVMRALREYGVQYVGNRDDSAEFWEALLERSYQLVVFGWRLSPLSGLVLFNRLRRHQLYRATPVLVFSSQLTEADFRLLEELPCTRLVDAEKATKQEITAAITSLMEEGNWYVENSEMIENVLDFIEADGAQALGMLRGPLQTAPNPVPLGVLMGRRLREAGFVAEAEELLASLVARNAQSVPALTELGKVMHVKGNEQEAFKLLERATALSPKNLQRLCLLGEVSLAMGDAEAAKQHLGAALGVDPEDSVASAGMEMVKQGLFPEKPSADAVARTLAATLNLRGVTLARQGRSKEAVEQYEGALRILLNPLDRARVAFNIGLCYMRWRKPQEARRWLTEAERLGEGRFEKPSKYLSRLKGADQPLKEPQSSGGAVVFEDEEEKLF